MEVLGSSAPAVFALRARITGFHPQDLSRACIPLPAPSGAAWSPMRRLRSALGAVSSQKQHWTFFFSIRLEDETGALDAVVCGGGGDFFFNQKPVKACDLSLPENEPTRREVGAVLAKRIAQREHYDLLVQSSLVRASGGEGGESREVKRFRILAVPDVRDGGVQRQGQGQGPE